MRTRVVMVGERSLVPTVSGWHLPDLATSRWMAAVTAVMLMASLLIVFWSALGADGGIATVRNVRSQGAYGTVSSVLGPQPGPAPTHP
jgi:hypothetical protein